MSSFNRFTAFASLVTLLICLGIIARSIPSISEVAHLATSDHNLPHAIVRNLLVRDLLDTSSTTPKPDPKEELSKEDWDKQVCKGGLLLDMMGKSNDDEAGKLFNPPREHAASDFQDFPNDFKKWGYSFVDQTQELKKNLAHDDLDKVFKDLGVSHQEDQWVGTRVWHVTDPDAAEKDKDNIDHQTYVVDGKTYRSSGADYSFAVNPNDGVLIIFDSFSPTIMGTHRTPLLSGDGLPSMQRLCDIVWGLWATQADGHDLKYIIIQDIMNWLTLGINREAHNRKGEQDDPWPGVEFSTDSDEGKALMASPNGYGVAYLLIQHKKQLGKYRKVSKITMYDTRGDDEPSMLLQLS
ncbi:hypothetical protein EJ04DRAFT_569550 [Polyplosphaeria fusca]|uniref:Uncharacterized protein n=1 Tax=Polyplosphaeria fusca TaxID=682080 RepID=A0A9P4QL12_9PLEO|nr:hypothetical protein EJ04DRAFT_569550 [Polyplosphaeria fusca]